MSHTGSNVPVPANKNCLFAYITFGSANLINSSIFFDTKIYQQKNCPNSTEYEAVKQFLLAINILP